MTGLYDDYQLLLDRIKSQCLEFGYIGSPAEIMSLDDVMQHLPACYVAPGEAFPAETGNRTQLKMEDQTWTVLITARYVPGEIGEPESTLGRLVLQTIDAIHYWQSPSFNGWLDYQNRSAIEYDAGFAFVRLTFIRRKLIQRT